MATSRASPAIWPPVLLSLLLALLARPLEWLFYHADLCAAYHASAAAAVYLTASLNALVAASPALRRRLRAVRDDADLFARLGPCNRRLLRAYLRGCFLLPNLAGPVWVWCSSGRLLDDLAHLYGFAVALLHAPLLASLAVRLVVPLACAALRRSLEATSRFVRRASDVLGDDRPGAAAAAQTALAALHARLGRLPGRVVDAVDGKLLRAEWAFTRLVAAFLAAVCVSALHIMVVDVYRPHLQRLAVRWAALALMSVGDAVFGVGMWVESIVVERGCWEDRSLWEVAGVA
ncbi:hypothetical protein LZ31DRAFT_607805 [Colletotrichum somersetense]|nr:hypothetical protein LZ31DRAFT_607805 [Colletotrichum somersetense]